MNKSDNNKIILSDKKFLFTLERIAHQLMENHLDFENTCMIGIQDRGGLFAERLYAILQLQEIP